MTLKHFYLKTGFKIGVHIIPGCTLCMGKYGFQVYVGAYNADVPVHSKPRVRTVMKSHGVLFCFFWTKDFKLLSSLSLSKNMPPKGWVFSISESWKKIIGHRKVV